MKRDMGPEERAWLGLAGIMPKLPIEEYLRLTAHYGEEHHMAQQKYRDRARENNMRFWALKREAQQVTP